MCKRLKVSEGRRVKKRRKGKKPSDVFGEKPRERKLLYEYYGKTRRPYL